MALDTYSRRKAENLLLTNTGIRCPCTRLLEKFFTVHKIGKDKQRNDIKRYEPRFTNEHMVAVATQSNIKSITEEYFQAVDTKKKKEIAKRGYSAIDEARLSLSIVS